MAAITPKTDIRSMSKEELCELMLELGEKKFRADQIFSWIHEKKVKSFDEMLNISVALRTKLAEKCELYGCEVCVCKESKLDGTKKYLFKLFDGQVIESVLMEYHHGFSVCVSSQVGCRMGCAFCASTIGGKLRDMTAGEILDEVYEIERLNNITVSNIVIMGTGEPFDNYDNIVRFIRLVTDEKGKNLSIRGITLSTCGLVPGIRKFTEEGLHINLALSLHAVNDEERRKIMPVANSYALSDVLAACDAYCEKTGRRITYEYSLIEGVNDSEEQAKALCRLLHGKNCHVNLIPVNPVTEREFKRSNMDHIQRFKNTLEKNRINVTIRREMGADIDAACGQLRRSFMEK